MPRKTSKAPSQSTKAATSEPKASTKASNKRAYNKRILRADSKVIEPEHLAKLGEALAAIDAGEEVAYTPLKLAQHATARLFRQDSKPCVIVTRSDGSAMCAVFTFPKPKVGTVDAPESWDTL